MPETKSKGLPVILILGILVGVAGAFGLWMFSGQGVAAEKRSGETAAESAEATRQKEAAEQKRQEEQKAKALAQAEKMKELAVLEGKVAEIKKVEAEIRKVVDETVKIQRQKKAEVWVKNSMIEDLVEAYNEADRRHKNSAKARLDAAKKKIVDLKEKLAAYDEEVAKNEEKLKAVAEELKIAEKAVSDFKHSTTLK